MLRILLSVLLSNFLFFNTLFSQIAVVDGYAINNNYDTIFGKFEHARSVLDTRMVFIKSPSRRITVLRPADVNDLVSYSGDRYESKLVEGKKVFLKVVSKGRINLYSDGMDLFISSDSGSVSELVGGKTNVTVHGSKFSQYVATYKSQIIAFISDPYFRAKINNLKFEKREIIGLIREINQDDMVNQKQGEGAIHVHNRGHFSVEAAVSIVAVYRTYFVNNIFGDAEFKIDRPKSWIVGVHYNRKIGKTRSYARAGIQYEKMPLTTGFQSDEARAQDTVFRRDEYFSYQLNSVNLALSFVPELMYGKVRPFIEAGFVSKFFLENDISGRRHYFADGVKVGESYDQLYIRRSFVAPRFGAGCRFLLNMDRSVSTGFYFEDFKLSHKNDVRRILHQRFYLSYGF